MPRTEQNTQSFITSRMVASAMAGALLAAVVGYGLSVLFSAAQLALVAPVEDVRSSTGIFFARAGLNYYAIHHIRIAGGGLQGAAGSTYVSILWPITMWAVIPAAALLLGGFVSSKLSRAMGAGKHIAGALIAVPYAIILLAATPLFSVASTGIALPSIPVPGLEFDPSLVASLLSPAPLSTILFGLLFGSIFGGIGSTGSLKALMRGFFAREAFWPSWARGAVIALIIGQMILFLMLLAGIIVGLSAQPEEREGVTARTWITILPTASGIVHYVAHGVTLRGQVTIMPGTSEAAPQERVYRAGLVRGIAAENKRSDMSSWAYLSILIPAAALIYGGFVAARSVSKPLSRLRLTVGFAGVYALFLTALTALYTLALRTVISFGETATSTTAIIGPSSAESFALGLIMAFVFGLIGASIYRPHAHT